MKQLKENKNYIQIQMVSCERQPIWGIHGGLNDKTLKWQRYCEKTTTGVIFDPTYASKG